METSSQDRDAKVEAARKKLRKFQAKKDRSSSSISAVVSQPSDSSLPTSVDGSALSNGSHKESSQLPVPPDRTHTPNSVTAVAIAPNTNPPSVTLGPSHVNQSSDIIQLDRPIDSPPKRIVVIQHTKRQTTTTTNGQLARSTSMEAIMAEKSLADQKSQKLAQIVANQVLSYQAQVNLEHPSSSNEPNPFSSDNIPASVAEDLYRELQLKNAEIAALHKIIDSGIQQPASFSPKRLDIRSHAEEDDSQIANGLSPHLASPTRRSNSPSGLPPPSPAPTSREKLLEASLRDLSASHAQLQLELESLKNTRSTVSPSTHQNLLIRIDALEAELADAHHAREVAVARTRDEAESWRLQFQSSMALQNLSREAEQTSRNSLDKAGKEVRSLQEQIESLKREHTSQIDKVNRNVDSLEKEKRELLVELKAKAGLQSSSIKLSEEKSQWVAERQSLKREIDRLLEVVAATSEHESQMQNELEAKEDKIVSLQSDLKKSKIDLAELRAESKRLSVECKAAAESAKEAISQKEQLVKKCATLEHSLSSQNATSELALLQEIANLKQELMIAKDEVETERMRAEDLLSQSKIMLKSVEEKSKAEVQRSIQAEKEAAGRFAKEEIEKAKEASAAQVKEELERIKISYETQTAKLNQQLLTLKDELEKERTRADHLTHRLNTVVAELDQANIKLKEVSQRPVEPQVATPSIDVAALESELSKTKQELALESERRVKIDRESSQTIAEYKTLLTEKGVLVKGFENRIADLERELVQVRKLLEEEQKLSSQLQSQIDEFSTIPPTETDASGGLTGNIDMLTNELESANSTITNLRDMVRSNSEHRAQAEANLQKLRLAQADIATMLLKGRSATSSDLVATLQTRCEELADILMKSQNEAAELRASVDSMRMHAHERDAALSALEDAVKAATAREERFRRERDTWVLREKTLYGEISRLTRESHQIGVELLEAKQLIWQETETVGWQRGALRADDINILDWVKWMVYVHGTLKRELEEAHAVLDLQHKRLESVIIAGSAVSESGQVEERRSRSSSVVESNGSRRPAPSSSSLRATAAWSSMVAQTIDRASIEKRQSENATDDNFRVNVSSQETQTDPETPPVTPIGVLLESNNTGANRKEEERLRASLTKLTARYIAVQQELTTLQAQLDHQMRVNNEIKRMIVDVTVQGVGKESAEGGSLLEKYNEVMVEIGWLRTELERWRVKCDEYEQAIEAVIIKASNE